jgi:ATPase involved in DNA repair
VTATTLEAGTYEVLRTRLADQAAELARRAEALNARRLEVFGRTDLRLVGTERIRTAHNCVPRDIVSLGGRMLFGYNVFIGLKPETTVGDVFSLHHFARDLSKDTFRFDHAELAELPGLFGHAQFRRDFEEIFRYYRDTRLLQLRKTEDKLLAVFQTGSGSAGTAHPPIWTTVVSVTIPSRRRTTSSGPRPPATTTSPASIRTSPSAARCSWRRWAARSP